MSQASLALLARWLERATLTVSSASMDREPHALARSYE